MRLIIPLILIALAVTAFVLYINPMYAEVRVLQEQEAQFDEALDRSKELVAIRDTLLSRFNTFAAADLARLEKLIPDNVDNVRLVMELDGIAAKYGMTLRDVSFGGQEGEDDEAPLRSGPLGTIDVGFTVSGLYEDFIRFLKDLEQSVRIVDVVSLSFDTTQGPVPDYDIIVRTYWLQETE